MTFGGEADEQMASDMYQRCRSAGINLFDCANVYNEGHAETILGRLIQHERHQIILTSKAYFPASQEINDCGLSRRHIFRQVDNSLNRLKTDYIDIYFMHRFDEHTPLEESLQAIDHLVVQGKILYLGVSNFAAWQIMKAIGLAMWHLWPRVQVIQPLYNLVKRQAEVEIFPLALSENVGVISYNPLAGGLLTGKYTSREPPPGTRFKERKMYQLRYQDAVSQSITNRFVQFAKERGLSPVSLAIAWAAHHPAVTSPLLGARNLQQLDECLSSLDIEMTQELYDQVTALSIEPPLATDRSDERVKEASQII